jgi:DNA-binding NarL/FixJ family response regulator
MIRFQMLLILVFACANALDIWHNLADGIELQHIWHQVGLLLLAIVSLVWQLKLLWEKSHEVELLDRELAEAKGLSQAWRARAASSAQVIRSMIDEQFGLWHLSQSEQEVALLLIKGFSMKEIAEIRDTHEKTVRQQAMAIYKKSGLSGRQQLAAFFLEDILTDTVSSK